MFGEIVQEKKVVFFFKALEHRLWTPNEAFFLGLNRTGHMSFLTGQDRTRKVAGQILPDWIESGLFLTFYLPSTGYQFS